jgi:integrase
MRGNITRRGKSSWRIKFEIGHDPLTGKRKVHTETVHGTKADAVTLLSKRLAERGENRLIERSAITVAQYARHWLVTIAPAKASGKTRERYGELIEKHIIPNIGGVELQKLDGPQIDIFYATLSKSGRRDGNGGLSPQTVRHIHRLLSLILASAVKAKKLTASPMVAVQTTPKVRRPDIQVLDDAEIAVLFSHLRGRPLYAPVLLAASTGMRRGEVLALRWKDVDLDKATLEVAQVVELVGGKLSVKEPKTERSHRNIALPARLVEELRSYRKEQLEYWIQLGVGRFELVFPNWDGSLRNPSHFTKAFSREVAAANLPHVTFHGLRHTHITHLLRSNVPVHVVSARAGHANPTVTINIYAHLLPGQQEGAAAVMDAALRQALPD